MSLPIILFIIGILIEIIVIGGLLLIAHRKQQQAIDRTQDNDHHT